MALERGTSAGAVGRNARRAGSWAVPSRTALYCPVYAATQQVGAEGLGDENGQTALRILLADEDPGALKVTAGQVRELGHTPTEIAVSLREAAEAIARDDPDLTIVVIYGDDEQHALDLIEEINAFSSGPVIALLDREDPEFVAAAADRGIFAYARQETADSIQSAIEVAMAAGASTTSWRRRSRAWRTRWSAGRSSSAPRGS